MSVEVRYLGHLGNNLFQYALGRILAEELGLALDCVAATDQPGWSAVERTSGIVDRLHACHARFTDAPQHLPGRALRHPQLRYVMGEKPWWTGQGLNLNYLLRHGRDSRIVLHGYFQQAAYYHPYRERIRRWFRFREAPAVPLHKDDLVVHLRQSLDMFVLDRAIDMDFYRDWLGGMRFRRLLVCGLGLGANVRRVLAPFKPVYLDLDGVSTLNLMTTARRIVMANSTFSWWGAYLSDAEEIHYPRMARNFWGADGDVDLEVPESRYHYIDDVPVHVWRPWRLRAPLHLHAETPGSAASVLAFAGPNPGRLQLPQALHAFARWLCEQGDQPFGMHELHACDMPASVLGLAGQLLHELRRRGVLACAAGSERLLGRSNQIHAA